MPEERKIAVQDNLNINFKIANLKVNISIDPQNRQKIVEGLSHLLADTYALYLKTHGYHWKVTPFKSLHLLLKEQSTQLRHAVDEIAEYIQALGFPVPETHAEILRPSSIPEDEEVLEVNEIIQLLIESQETVIRTARLLVPKVEQAQDQLTLELLTERIRIHEKEISMLTNHLEDQSDGIARRQND